MAARQIGLADIVAKIVKPLGVTRVRIDATATRRREKINVEPGDTAWDALANVAEANGLWPWFEPDGTLVVGGPDYTTAPVATLVMRRNGTTNVERLDERRSIAGRHRPRLAQEVGRKLVAQNALAHPDDTVVDFGLENMVGAELGDEISLRLLDRL